jgi:hypothetical protein
LAFLEIGDPTDVVDLIKDVFAATDPSDYFGAHETLDLSISPVKESKCADTAPRPTDISDAIKCLQALFES